MIWRFRHEAMNTVFDAAFSGVGETDARHAARAVFDAVDRLERILSRFLPGSDIWQIRAMKEGDVLRVRPETVECLKVARECSERTGGAFDVGLGAEMDAWREKRALSARPDAALVIDEESLSVACEREGMNLDLGAIGKGFALDAAARLLREDWEISRARLSAGTSTILALDAPEGAGGWMAGVESTEVALARSALSCSGTSQRGGHILDPRTGMPGARHERVWVKAPSAAVSDALSTGVMLMEPAAIAELVSAAGAGGVEAWCADGLGGLRHYAPGAPQASTSM